MPNPTVPAAGEALPKETRARRKESDFESALSDTLSTMNLVSLCLWDIFNNSTGSHEDGVIILRMTDRQRSALQRSADLLDEELERSEPVLLGHPWRGVQDQ